MASPKAPFDEEGLARVSPRTALEQGLRRQAEQNSRGEEGVGAAAQGDSLTAYSSVSFA